MLLKTSHSKSRLSVPSSPKVEWMGSLPAPAKLSQRQRQPCYQSSIHLGARSAHMWRHKSLAGTKSSSAPLMLAPLSLIARISRLSPLSRRNLATPRSVTSTSHGDDRLLQEGNRCYVRESCKKQIHATRCILLEEGANCNLEALMRRQLVYALTSCKKPMDCIFHIAARGRCDLRFACCGC